jgi:CheY-like chemotaxis protein
MKDSAPIFIVDDDDDDQTLINEVCKELEIPNPIHFFDSGENLLLKLKDGSNIPFIIVCDVNLGGMDGFELRNKVLEDKNIKYKTIPFIFWSNSASKSQIRKAYDLCVHGFFIKESSYKEIKSSFRRIIDYWHKSEQPDLV